MYQQMSEISACLVSFSREFSALILPSSQPVTSQVSSDIERTLIFECPVVSYLITVIRGILSTENCTGFSVGHSFQLKKLLMKEA